MRQKTAVRLRAFWDALTVAAQGPQRLVKDPLRIAARCGASKQTAYGMTDTLNRAGYLMTITASDSPGCPIIGVSLTGRRWNIADFVQPKLKPTIIPAPTPAPVAAKITFRQRIALFLDLDNLCINLQKLGMILGISDIIQSAAKEGIVIACFGFIQRSTLERNREAVNGFPPELDMVVAPDYSQASDQKMLQMIRRFADNNIADTFFIGTADTVLFETAQSAVKRVGKRAVLLDCCQLSFGIRSEADRIFRMQNAAVPETKANLLRCAQHIAKTKRRGRGREAEFLRNVVRKLRMVLSGDANKRGEEFRKLQNRVWYWLKQHGEAIGWHPQDCQYALEALRTLNIITAHRGTDEKTYYRLNREAETYRVF